MSNIERHTEHSAVGVSDYQSTAVARLTEWAQSAAAASEIASQLVRSSFVPESFRGKAHEATAAILAGIEVGLQPMAALRSFDVIQGQAAPRAVTLRAILQSQGHEIELVDSTATRCKMRGRRKGADAWQEVLWTIDRAKQLKLTGKANWQNQPQAMLVARATSELARLVASDAILGIAYSVEEIADGLDSAASTVQDDTAGTKKMSRNRQDTAVAQEPPADEPPADEPPADDERASDADAVTEAQIRKMAVAFRAAGIMDRADRIGYIAAIVGREVASSKDLSKSETSHVIESLVALELIDAEIVESDGDPEMFADEASV